MEILEYTGENISGKAFSVLMDFCFEHADCFSLGKARWTFAKDARIEDALDRFLIGRAETEHWFCYGGTRPPLRIRLYKAESDAKKAFLLFSDNLYFESPKKYFCSLEDICFFRDGKLFLGTVSHEHICCAHIFSDEFRLLLEGVGNWKDVSNNTLARLNLDKFKFL